MAIKGVETGLVTAQFVIGIVDGDDLNDEPDLIGARGTVEFTPVLPYVPVPVGPTNAFTLINDTFVGILDEEGYLCTPSPTDTSSPGARGIRLFATDNPNASVVDWTWRVRIRFVGSTTVIPTFTITVPAGGVVDLSTVVKVPESTGVGTDQSIILVAAAQQAAQEASRRATEAIEEASSAGVSAYEAAQVSAQALAVANLADTSVRALQAQVDAGGVGSTGPAGPAGPVGPQGPKGDTGAASTIAGPAGPEGPQGRQGIQGPKGDTGAASTVPGPKGDTGTQGPIGLPGGAGPAGPKGDTGADSTVAGPQGPKGDKGDTGKDGTSVTIKGTVPTVSALPTAGNVSGDGYIISADGHLHVWGGSAWTDAGEIRGPKGETGATGEAGDAGPAGTAASITVSGTTTGAAGTSASVVAGGTATARTLAFTIPQGVQGIQGPKGDTGAASTVPGPAGPQGIQGIQGPVGAASTVPGPKGDTGAAGADSTVPGPAGPKGDKGDVGPQGPTGEGLSGRSSTALPWPNASVLTPIKPGHAFTQGGTPANVVMEDPSDSAVSNMCITITTDGKGGQAWVQSPNFTPIDMTNRGVLLWVKIENTTDMAYVVLDVITNNSFSNRWRGYVMDPNGMLTSNDWVAVPIPWSNLVAVNGFGGGPTGTPDRTKVTGFRVTVADKNGRPNVLKVGGIGYYDEKPNYPKGVVSFTFDDSFEAAYTIGAAKMSEFAYRGTLFPIINRIGQSGFLSMSQVRNLHDIRGWEIGAHASTTASHINYTNLTAQQIATELSAIRLWQQQNGFESNSFAYPVGPFNQTSIEQISRFYRGARSNYNQVSTHSTMQPYRVSGIVLTPSVTLAAVKKRIDEVVTGGGWQPIVVHNLGPTLSGANEWTTENFNALVDYVAASGAAVETFGEVLSSQKAVSGPKGDQGPIGATGAASTVAGPTGATGPQGPAGTVAVSGTTTGAAGSAAAVTAGGTATARTLAFTIPRGDTGAQGPQGIQGPKGDTGAVGPAGPNTKNHIFAVRYIGSAWEYTSLAQCTAAGMLSTQTIWFIGGPSVPAWARSGDIFTQF